jgi:hypothetical protein
MLFPFLSCLLGDQPLTILFIQPPIILDEYLMFEYLIYTRVFSCILLTIVPSQMQLLFSADISEEPEWHISPYGYRTTL